MAISKSIIIDKIQDLLAMEIMASEIYKKALKLAESEAHQKTLYEMMNEELSHVELVKEMLELVER